MARQLEQLGIVYESSDDIKEDSGDAAAGGLFNRYTHEIVLSKDLDFSPGSWGREAAYHELAHATRLYYDRDDAGRSAYVTFSGPDDQTDAMSEALNSLFADSLMDEDEKPDVLSYQLQCNYADVILGSLDGYELGDYLSHSSQWLTQKLDKRLGDDEGQLLLELMQLQKDDLSDGRVDVSLDNLHRLSDDLCELDFDGSIHDGTTYEEVASLADELVARLSDGVSDADEAIDSNRIGLDLRAQCRQRGVDGVPAETYTQYSSESAAEASDDSHGLTTPEGVSYLSSFAEVPQATYKVLAYGSSIGGTSAGNERDQAAESNEKLARQVEGGGGQYLAFYQDGTCRLFKTSDGTTADVETGYWDGNGDGSLRNYALAYVYYDNGVLQGEDGLTFAKGSRREMLLEPSSVDVRTLKSYRIAQRGRENEYEQDHAFEGGWTVESVKVSGVESDSLDVDGYQSVYIDGFFLCRIASDGEKQIVDGRFDVESLTWATCEEDGTEHTFELVSGDELVERFGGTEVTYRRDDAVGNPWG